MSDVISISMSCCSNNLCQYWVSKSPLPTGFSPKYITNNRLSEWDLHVSNIRIVAISHLGASFAWSI